jgi:hypothetical protein
VGKEDVEEFLKKTEIENDSIATDYVSHFLKLKISQVKENRKSVLIVDDFDRVDPEHIFRILNVLSTHMEGEEENKLGFDHIIIVGDIDNIESIFRHKYGAFVDFWGYFNKFFTIKPYFFDNTRAVKETIPSLLNDVKCDDLSMGVIFSNGKIIHEFLEEILVKAFDIGRIDLRDLYKPLKYNVFNAPKSINTRDPFIDIEELHIDSGIKLLIDIFKSKKYFITVLAEIRGNPSIINDKTKDWFYRECSNAILRRMLSLKDGQRKTWLKTYELLASQSDTNTSRVNVYLEDENAISSGLFYDTLIEYIKQSKYEKKDWYEYMKRHS